MLKKPAAKTLKAPLTDEIPVWFVEVHLGHSWSQYHLRLSHEVAKGLEKKLRKLVTKEKIANFNISRIDKLVVPAFVFYEQFGLDR